VAPAARRRLPPSAEKAALLGRDREQIEQLSGRHRHGRLDQDRHLPDHLGGE